MNQNLFILALISFACAQNPVDTATVKEDSLQAAPAEIPDSLAAGDSVAADSAPLPEEQAVDTKPVRPLAVFFLGAESRTEGRIHGRLEERLFHLLNKNSQYAVRGPQGFAEAGAKTGISRKEVTLAEARKLRSLTGDRLFVSVDVREFRMEVRRSLAILPVGRVRGEVVCHLQVLDAERGSTRFSGDVRFVGEGDLNYLGYGERGGLLPFSAVEERYFTGELLKGTAETLAETVAGAVQGLIEKNARPH